MLKSLVLVSALALAAPALAQSPTPAPAESAAGVGEKRPSAVSDPSGLAGNVAPATPSPTPGQTTGSTTGAPASGAQGSHGAVPNQGAAPK